MAAFELCSETQRLVYEWKILFSGVYLDSAYRHHSRVHSYGIDNDFNGKMKSVCVSIEWNYDTIASHFFLCRYEERFKVHDC